MLWTCDDRRVVRVIALHPANVGNPQPGGEERILAVGFLPAAPARIAEDVDVGRPGVEPAANASTLAKLAGKPMQLAHFRADRCCDVVHRSARKCASCIGLPASLARVDALAAGS